jgi:hypothetical protein
VPDPGGCAIVLPLEIDLRQVVGFLKIARVLLPGIDILFLIDRRLLRF